MLHLHEQRGTSWYRTPVGIGRCWIDPLTGREVPKDHARAIQEIFAFKPESARPEDYDSANRVRLPAEYSAWLLSNQNTSIPLLHSRANHLRILQTGARQPVFSGSRYPRERSAACLECRV